MEDAQFLEVCDIETGRPVEDGQDGDMVCTCLYKDDIYPIIRFNTHDVTRVRTGTSSLGVNFKRIEGFLGRSDNMVKIRGINIFPQAMSPILEEVPGFAGEFICRAERDETGRDEFTVCVEAEGDRDADMAALYGEVLKRSVGIECGVELFAPGELADLTQTEVRQKPIRLIDRRFS
jgi:phenylacetate-CoA ligase